MFPTTIHTNRCLIIPDVHQNIDWVKAILERELTSETRVVFLGDYFDPRGDLRLIAGARETARFFRELQESLADRVTLLIGNHDLPYLEGAPYFFRHRKPPQLIYPCSGYSVSRGNTIFKEWDREFLLHFSLCAKVNGHLLSHAGIAAPYWPEAATPEESWERFGEHCRTVMATFRHHYHPLLGAGISRGGREEVGGLVWQDWDDEFTDDLPFPQIVGHTIGPTARRKGRSWCLDGAQSTYGILQDREITIRSIP